MAEHIRIETTFNNKYLGEWDLPDDGKDMIVKIKDVVIEDLVNQNGGKEQAPVLYFENDVKPMILGAKVNKNNIKAALGTSYMDEWVGKKIQLYREPGTWFGKTGFAIRIRDFAPSGK